MVGSGTVSATLRDDGTLRLGLDDGGRNTLRPDVLDDLGAAVAAHPSAPVLLVGREGVLSAGLDLKWMAAHGPDDVAELLVACGRALAALWLHPRPVVVAATGHAIAAGTLLAMTGDHVVAGEGGAWGLVETANGMELPDFALSLARTRLTPRDLTAVVLPGARLDAAGAARVGFADEAVAADAVLPRAEERLAELAALPAAAYAANKQRLRGAEGAAMLGRLRADVDGLIAAFHATLS
jgi:enoyl-CoA hydratase